MPDITTIAACSTALAAIMAIAIGLSWLKDGRPGQRSWLFAPFGMAVPAGVLLTYPDILPGPWGLRLGWFLLTLVYGAAWLAARVMGGRRARPLAVLLPCTAVLVFSGTLGADDAMSELRMLPRVLLFAAFNGLAAREFGRMRSPRLPSATTLYWIFSAFFAFDLIRSPFALWLPAPLGPGDTQVWSIALFNFLIVLEGSLLGVFMTALGREQLAERHYQLASIDPLTGIGNRRALDDRIAHLEREHDSARSIALAVLDIDNFKSINDALGHAFGDVVIAETAKIARDCFGANNVFRVGGEEFAAIVTARQDDAVVERAEAMRKRYEGHSHRAGSLSRRCTISIGLSRLEDVHDHENAFKAADRALYMAKRLGRNQTVVIDSAAPCTQPPAAEIQTNVSVM
ncbi:GGDEF domain-containing protein [Novosphingobium mangrovi (ex Huang et al. 2023)]|uniref:diguanylate cyclase n=1 Tax=Novosphingobium mangrovi (ex Huang et al. 2023) TaxID=2976432 RepID=A0ABT2I778_9SPHN|nr:GGDEF domain-containing protein [Novosphingobium mangrovi (ex Huang et al. 2023)]MCT2400670.1 GGDEF domain-containing protein [Novosphingobium mangrovi (ex Huang et al. 2023)]